MTLLDAQGRVGQLLRLEEFLDPVLLATRLTQFADEVGASTGQAVVPPRIPRTARKTQEDDLLLYLVSRFQVTKADQATHEAALAEVQRPPTGWEAAPANVLKNRLAAPAQDWFLLTAQQWRSLVGSATARAGSTWSVPTEAATAIGVHLGPPGETYGFEPRRVESQVLTARLLSAHQGLRTIELNGSLVMAQPWWDHTDDERAQCRVVGLLTYNEGTDRIESFQLASIEARYVGGELRPSLSIPYAIGMKMPDATDLLAFGG
jgi:hypothetical protein